MCLHTATRKQEITVIIRSPSCYRHARRVINNNVGKMIQILWHALTDNFEIPRKGAGTEKQFTKSCEKLFHMKSSPRLSSRQEASLTLLREALELRVELLSCLYLWGVY